MSAETVPQELLSKVSQLEEQLKGYVGYEDEVFALQKLLMLIGDHSDSSSTVASKMVNFLITNYPSTLFRMVEQREGLGDHTWEDVATMLAILEKAFTTMIQARVDQRH